MGLDYKQGTFIYKQEGLQQECRTDWLRTKGGFGQKGVSRKGSDRGTGELQSWDTWREDRERYRYD